MGVYHTYNIANAYTWSHKQLCVSGWGDMCMHVYVCLCIHAWQHTYSYACLLCAVKSNILTYCYIAVLHILSVHELCLLPVSSR